MISDAYEHMVNSTSPKGEKEIRKEKKEKGKLETWPLYIGAESIFMILQT